MCILPWYVISHLGQLSLLPSAGQKVSTSQWAVAELHDRESNHRSDIHIYPPTGSMA